MHYKRAVVIYGTAECVACNEKNMQPFSQGHDKTNPVVCIDFHWCGFSAEIIQARPSIVRHKHLFNVSQLVKLCPASVWPKDAVSLTYKWSVPFFFKTLLFAK